MRIKRSAHCYVRRPGNSGIGAIGIEQLGTVVRSISVVVPYSIKAPIGRYGKCAEPVPLVRQAIVIDPVRRAEGQSSVCAAHKHHVGCRSPRWFHAGQHVNVVVSRTAGAIDRQKCLPSKPPRIDCAAENQVATHIDVLSYPVKDRCLVPDLSIARANTGKRVPLSADKEIAIGVHIQGSICRPAWNDDWCLPGDATVGRALELYPAPATVNPVARLILESMPGTACLVYRKPLLVASTSKSICLQFHPGFPTVC